MTVRRSLFALAFLVACSSGGSNVIEATGTLELVEVDVSPQVMARVTKVLRDEGDRIRVGETLMTLTQSALPSEIVAKRAAVRVAEAHLRDLLAGPRESEIEAADAAVRAAEAEATRTAQDLERLIPLAGHGTVSQQQADAARAAAHEAANRLAEARERARLVRQGARPQEIAGARAEVAAARATLAGVEQTARDLTLRSTIDGTVLSRHVEPGEVLSPGVSGMTLGDVTRPYVWIYVDQVTLPQIRVGDTATVLLDALPDQPFKGTVVALADRAEFTPRVALTKDERADLMFGVKVEVYDPSRTLKAGLPVTVRIVPGATR